MRIVLRLRRSRAHIWPIAVAAILFWPINASEAVDLNFLTGKSRDVQLAAQAALRSQPDPTESGLYGEIGDFLPLSDRIIAEMGWKLYNPEVQRPVAAMIVREAHRLEIPSAWVLRRGWAESNFRHMVHLNSDGSVDHGPMQVNDKAWPEIVGMPTALAVRRGVEIFRDVLVLCGWEEACAHHAYRTGEVRRKQDGEFNESGTAGGDSKDP